MIRYNTAIVLLGVSLLGATAGTVGSFAVLRRRALVGDALAHAALPGLCIGFLVVGERQLFGMLAGAFVAGILGVWLINAIKQHTRIQEDAAIGIVLSVLFGVGIVLSRAIQNSPTVSGSKAGLDSYIYGKTAGMAAIDLYSIMAITAIALLALILLFKEFQLISFDRNFGFTQGWPVRFLDLLLTGLIALIVVVGLPAVGVVMIASLLIIPGVIARFWTNRLANVAILSAFIGMVMGSTGTMLSATISQLPTGPTITLVGTLLFLLTALFAPQQGILANWRVRRANHLHVDYVDFLLWLRNRPQPILVNQPQSRWSSTRFRQLLQLGIDRQHLQFATHEEYLFTSEGLAQADYWLVQHQRWQGLLLHYPEWASQIDPYHPDGIEAVIPKEVLELCERESELNPSSSSTRQLSQPPQQT
ncbi:MAG: iron chelate uptake ABC transporter family permease subunit [Zavarzinella sp.]